MTYRTGPNFKGWKLWHLDERGEPYPHSSIEIRSDGSAVVVQDPVMTMAWGHDWWAYVEGTLIRNPWWRTLAERFALRMSW